MLRESRVRTTLPALDLERAKRFWGETLGLEIVLDRPDGVVFRGGQPAGEAMVGWSDSVTFLVYPSPNPARGGHTQMGFRVDDIDAAAAELRAAGVALEEYDTPSVKTVEGVASIAGGHGKGAWFKDSEGNLIGVVQLEF